MPSFFFYFNNQSKTLKLHLKTLILFGHMGPYYELLKTDFNNKGKWKKKQLTNIEGKLDFNVISIAIITEYVSVSKIGVHWTK